MESTISFCTVITTDYLPRATALYQSLLAHNPSSKFYALVIDGSEEEKEIAQNKTPFSVSYLSDVNVEGLGMMKQNYNSFELCNALRPFWIKHLMQNPSRNIVIYLDSDIFVVGSFKGLTDIPSNALFALTPHILTPYPMDDQKPDDMDMMLHGMYNSGFVYYKRDSKTEEILDFLISRNKSLCFRKPPFNTSDQKIFPLAISLYHDYFYQINDPAYNIAYWNLHERKLTTEGNGFKVNGENAVFFHLSGFDPNKPDILTKWPCRHSLENDPVLKKVIAHYFSFFNKV